ncbi:MAG: hypothetical protein RML93_04835 [Anaerolineales bacterium]|nr:SPFH domain-containing protein [Anaerolineales bacterium]MCS7248029.1 SPFH domain-containing protein [Anaerolineales bacterium]MDW8161841.1 hypothetical protein [Anaerolineales bacterium]MDW8446603.1 hypothetical protein [Anaerolineales bacterium]
MRRLYGPLSPLCLFLSSFLRGQHAWGRLRLFGLLVLGIGLGMLWGAALESRSLYATAERLRGNTPLLGELPTPLLILLLVPSQWRSLRFLFVPFLAFGLAFLLSARYLQDIYHLPSFRSALHYLLACLFGISYPTLKVDPSERGDTESTQSSYLLEIGGPGHLQVPSGYAVAVSSLRATPKIYLEGKHFLLPGERLEEIADLRDQTDSIDAISTLCYEGIAIRISDVHFGYRLWQTPPPEHAFTFGNGFKTASLSLQPLRSLFQSRVVTEQGLTEWRTMVRGMIRSVISDFIYRHSVIELLRPPANYNPYADLKRTFHSRAFRARLRKMGTELLWINVGLFDLDKEPHKKLLKLWQHRDTPISPPAASAPQPEDMPQATESGRARAKFTEEILETLESSLTPEEAVDRLRSFLMLFTTPPSTLQSNTD